VSAANPVRGETCFETEDGRAFKVVFDLDAVCALEDLRDRPAAHILTQVVMGRIGFVRDALWCGLRRHHEDLTQADVSAFLLTIKDTTAGEIVSAGLQVAFPKRDKGKGEGAPADPPPAPDETGTGKPS